MAGQIDQYKLEDEIGTGGMATVYRALDTQLERPAAIKVLHDHIARDSEHRERFVREARAVARLRHGNIVQIFSFAGDSSENSYIAMELVNGPTLRAFVDEERDQPLPPEVGAMILCIAADALHEAHEHGVLHRDIKPENIMIDDSGTVKLMDFGLARLLDAHSVTATGSLLGSPAHMAPEIIEGEQYDRRVDIFSLGTVLYYACTGELPFDGSNPAIVLRKVLSSDFVPPSDHNPDILPRLDSLISRSLHLDPAERPPTARAFANELKAVLFEAGINDVHTEFERFWKAPEEWIRQFQSSLSQTLLAEAEAARDAGRSEYPRAIAYCSRVLHHDPENERALELIESLGGLPDEQNGRWRLIAVGALLLVLIAAGVFWYQQHRQQVESAERVASCIDESRLLLSEAVTVARTATTTQLAQRATMSALNRALEDTGILQDARALDAQWAALTRVKSAVRAADEAATERAEANAQRVADTAAQPDTTRTGPLGGERPPDAAIDGGAALPSFEVTFIISPPVANLYADGELICSGTPRCTRELRLGSHSIIARHPETRMQTERQIEVADSGAQYRLRVPWPPAGLYIESNVPATVLFDGDRIGRTGELIRIPIEGIGRVRRGVLRVIPDGSFNSPVEETISLVAGETTRDAIRFRTAGGQ
jgi:serine/threonine-protein kinase